MTDQSPILNVGILSAREIRVYLDTPYRIEGSAEAYAGDLTFSLSDNGEVIFDGKSFAGVELRPMAESGAWFEVKDVTIGVNFHWERKENQRFTGALGIIVEGLRPGEGELRLTLVNRLPVEDYLKSVISSEMSATSSEALLKAHAVISRSWLFAQLAAAKAPKSRKGWVESETERVIWYDREDHLNFDVCADDHCQRYQGITRQSRREVEEAVDATRGVMLTDASGEVCDARFSKCCGGVFEEFESCWQEEPHPYLKALRDGRDETDFPDLRNEEAAGEWILGSPAAFCNTRDARVLSEVLNSYDQETPDFYRWKVEYMDFFEPPYSMRGRIARTFFYMAAVYHACGLEADGFMMFSEEYPYLTPYAVRLLCQWSREQQPDHEEMAWAEYVGKLQGVVNPFVSDPELAEYIWGDKSGEVYAPEGAPVPLHSTYRMAGDRIYLTSPHVPDDAVWTIDGVQAMSDSYDPRDLGAGEHHLTYISAATGESGRLMIKIESK